MSPLATLVATSQQVAANASRLAKIHSLGGYLTSLPTHEVDAAVHYLSGTLPQGRMGIGYRLLRSAAQTAAAPTASLEIHDVDTAIRTLSGIDGAGATARRTAALEGLFAAATEAEQDFLLRLLAGELRQGALDGVMIDAIAAASQLPAAQVRRAAMYAPGLGRLATVALAEGSSGLQQLGLQMFQPFAPMLAQTAADTGEALGQLGGSAQFEWKMDGARIQVHKRGEEVRIYTRGLNEMSAALPEITEAIRQWGAEQLILDGEALAVVDGRPQPFQTTMRRFGRRLNVPALLQELPMRAFLFDCLLVDGRVLTDRPLHERVRVLESAVPEQHRMPRLQTSDEAAAAQFYDAALAAGHEGVMAKALDSEYEAGNRGANWLKVKRAHTLDLVILAAEWGNGRRQGLLSNLHLGALDPDTGAYVMLGKTFKGLTDAMLAWQTRELLAREVRREGATVFVRPELVAEIAFSDLQASPRYPGGIALRLARVKRFREDKRASDADTMAAIRRIHAAQG